MVESQEYLKRERRRIDEQAEALAKDKGRILPKSRHAEHLPPPAPTMRDFRKWQWSILGLIVIFNLGAANSYLKTLGNPPEVMRIMVDESQVRPSQDVDTGEKLYVIELKSDDLRPYVPSHDALPLLAWGVVNAALAAALVYTRYRMWHAPREENAVDA